MKEGIPEEEAKEIDWEAELAAAGMPSELPTVENDLKESAQEIATEAKRDSLEKEIETFHPALKVALSKFADLPKDIQKMIIADVKDRKNENMPLEDIAIRIFKLVEGSDRMLSIPPVEEKEEGNEEIKKKKESYEEIIERMERMLHQEERDKKDSLVN